MVLMKEHGESGAGDGSYHRSTDHATVTLFFFFSVTFRGGWLPLLQLLSKSDFEKKNQRSVNGILVSVLSWYTFLKAILSVT